MPASGAELPRDSSRVPSPARTRSNHIVAPITSRVRLPLSPVYALLEASTSTGLNIPSLAVLTQIRAVDRQRLIRRLGQAHALTMAEVDRAVQIALGLMPATREADHESLTYKARRSF